jgi:Uma2 family endonuclease
MQGEARNFSRDDYEMMIRAGIIGEDEHVELIGGRIVEMSPEGPLHAGAIDLCADALRRVFGADHTVRVQHPLAVDPDDEPEPESSLAYDRGDKARVYARAGLPEYWIVNLVDRRVEVHREPTAAGYHSVVLLAKGDAIAPLACPAAAISVATLLP